MGQFIDFAALKTRVSIEDVVSLLNLKVKREGLQWRAECPYCKSGGPRALSINVKQNVFRCFANGGTGGDQLALYAHVMGTSQRHAAEYLDTQFPAENSPRHVREGSRSTSLAAEALASLGSEDFEDFNNELDRRFTDLEKRVSVLEESNVIPIRRKE